MRNDLIVVLLALVMASAVRAQEAGSSATDTNAPGFDSATIEVASSSGGLTGPVDADPASNEFTSFGLGAKLNESPDASTSIWMSDMLAVDGGVGQLFVGSAAPQARADDLFPKLDVFRAHTRALLFYMGIGRTVWFEECGDTRAGIRAPVGVSYPFYRHRLEFFAEIAPMLDVAPTTGWGWTGALGIRFFLER
jgi:hypothetical protein